MTAPARTLIDYTSTTGADEAERAIAEAFGLKLVTQPQLLAAIERTPHRAGVATVRAILGQPGGPSRTRSGGERAMLRLIRAARLPPPRTNYVVAGYSADFCWPDQRLIVEGRSSIPLDTIGSRARSPAGPGPSGGWVRSHPFHGPAARGGAGVRRDGDRPRA